MYIYVWIHHSFGCIFDFMSVEMMFCPFTFVGSLSLSRLSSAVTIHIHFLFSFASFNLFVCRFFADSPSTNQHFFFSFSISLFFSFFLSLSFVFQHFAGLTKVSNLLKTKHTKVDSKYENGPKIVFLFLRRKWLDIQIYFTSFMLIFCSNLFFIWLSFRCSISSIHIQALRYYVVYPCARADKNREKVSENVSRDFFFLLINSKKKIIQILCVYPWRGKNKIKLLSIGK